MRDNDNRGTKLVDEFWRKLDENISKTRSANSNKLETFLLKNQNSLNLRYKFPDSDGGFFSKRRDADISNLIREVKSKKKMNFSKNI